MTPTSSSKLKLNMTSEEISAARQGWSTKLTSALKGHSKQHSEVLSLDISASLAALEALDRIEPVAADQKAAALKASATPPRFTDEGGSEPRPKTGPYAKPGSAGSSPVKANLPPPETAKA